MEQGETEEEEESKVGRDGNWYHCEICENFDNNSSSLVLYVNQL